MSRFIKLTLRESGRTIAIDATRVSKIREFKEGGCVVVGHEVNCEVSQSIDEILAQIGGDVSEHMKDIVEAAKDFADHTYIHNDTIRMTDPEEARRALHSLFLSLGKDSRTGSRSNP